MLNFKKEHKFLFFILFSLGSFLAGGVNGFLGTGGGIIFVFLLSTLTENERKDNFATTICATLAISLVGLFAYFKAGAVDLKITSELFLPIVLGGIVGAILVDKLKIKYLSLIFSALIIYSGISMIVR